VRRVLTLIALAACSVGKDAPDAFDPKAPRITASIDPPAIAPGGTFVLDVAVENFTLVPPSGNPNEGDRGHYHVYLDDLPNYLASDSASQRNVTVASDLPLGDHRIKVQLANHDHTDHEPAVFTLLSLECLDD
jgi:hypothetical protein